MPDVPQCRKYLLWNCLASLRQKQNIAAQLEQGKAEMNRLAESVSKTKQ